MAAIRPAELGMQKHKQTPQRGSTTTTIPDKLYFRIGEVAKLCQVQAYVLRFWESEFPQLKPNKSGTGQRLYRRRDVEMALQVKRLLHEEGYTIAGARHVLQTEGRESKKQDIPQSELPLKVDGAHRQAVAKNEMRLQRLRSELKDLLNMLSAAPASAPRERKSKKPALQNRPSLFGE
jgi:DNA-binding transcriptional MerR regulator